MKHITPFIFLIIFNCGTALGQSGGWDALADVKFQTKTDPEQGYEIDYPVFGKSVKSLDGKEIVLKGFIIPLDEMTSDNQIVLSSLPYNSCFFCGGAGPETVIQVNTQEKIEYTTDIVFIKGVFMLNEKDPNKLMYIMNEGILISEE